jgi:pimeloyl-ACP methyl ester carboxylesterase
MSRSSAATSPAGVLARNAFWIVLDPESGNGHTLFADSANNGPCGEALVKELIPALEAKYRLAPEAKARLLRGHSSGGWSTLWLALRYPETFGATWSTSPDPVDFRKFQTPDIYSDINMYGVQQPTANGGEPTFKPHSSYRAGGQSKMTIAQENQMEEVLGPDNTSAQQWDSWQAVWGPRNDRGHPAALYDPQTGVLDHALAEKYRPYDIADLVRREGGKYGPILHQRCRVVVGTRTATS